MLNPSPDRARLATFAVAGLAFCFMAPPVYASPHHRLRANLLRVGLRLQAQLNLMLEPYGLTQQQFNVLRILRGQLRLKRDTSFSTQDLRDLLLDKMADASRLVDRLADKGWLTKEPCDTDKRKVNIQITESGLAVLSEIDKVSLALDELLSDLDVNQAETLSLLLEKVKL